MKIELNGKPHELAAECTLAQLIDQLQLGGKRIAVEVNRELVPRSQFTEHRLCQSDCVEIVHAIGGGC